MKLICSILTVLLVTLLADGFVETLRIQGTLMCGQVPLANVTVQLIERDPGYFYQLASTVSDSKGYFEIEGWNEESAMVEPFINIKHTCGLEDDKSEPLCMKIYPSLDYVVQPLQNLNSVYDVGILNLEAQYQNLANC
ncbi:Transthyretin-like protein 46 [Trichinella zimbabwensis]|uniref:Transthyretin-like protein 46 n=1 Tax=Trichinella zimbabwensis TaxID=268475 RepID=A0A0V1HYU6_9BILA|nr:Transthyretin-like protein 46 [Trichinella zimbabwensis]